MPQRGIQARVLIAIHETCGGREERRPPTKNRDKQHRVRNVDRWLPRNTVTTLWAAWLHDCHNLGQGV